MTTITVSGRTYRVTRDGYGHVRVNDADAAEYREDVRNAAWEVAMAAGKEKK